MRLTLRTLLAYLDDTLQATEIKEIGQKVAESDAAQELIARLKAVTRRRRLTAPTATGPNALDPNRVAAYLDNELPSDELAELEKLALESDVHLAEIAACHQILTLVLGEPALVPPTARERMYFAGQGREAIPSRKAAPVKKAADDHGGRDETFGLSGGWLKWVLPAAGLLLVVALGLAVYQILPPRDGRQAAVERKTNGAPSRRGDGPEGRRRTRTRSKASVAVPEKDKAKGKVRGSRPRFQTRTGKAPVPPPTIPPVKDPGVVDRRRRRRRTGWRRASTSAPTPPSSPASWCGKRGCRTGPALRLAARRAQRHGSHGRHPGGAARLHRPGPDAQRGGNPAARPCPRILALFSSRTSSPRAAVKLHKNDKFDLDMTLLRGRMYISNLKGKDDGKGELKVRLRFETEVWDLVLERGTEVGFDLIKVYTPGINYRTGDEPRATLGLCLIRGEMEVQAGRLPDVQPRSRRQGDDYGLGQLRQGAGDPVRWTRCLPLWDKTTPNPAEERSRGPPQRPEADERRAFRPGNAAVGQEGGGHRR